MSDTVIKYSLLYTKNLGNFENIKIEVGMESPLNGKHPDQVLERVRTWVEDSLGDATAEVVASIGGN